MLISPISCFCEVLAALTSDAFQQEYMKLPREGDGIPDRIQKDPKLFPFFQDCVGAIDGSHMFVRPPSATRGPWRDRKGNLSQNMLAVCDFDMNFTYVLVGWEGSVADSTLYLHATRNGGLVVPDGKYWIADAGFASCSTLLVPYRNVRYHLREWAAGNSRYIWSSSCHIILTML